MGQRLMRIVGSFQLTGRFSRRPRQRFVRVDLLLPQVVSSRMSGSNDFAGQWRDTSYLQRHADMTLRLDSQTLHIGYPSAGQYVDAPLDGVDAAVQGPHAPEGTTYSARLIGGREIFTLTKRDGKVLTQESLKLSNDGRDITYS